MAKRRKKKKNWNRVLERRETQAALEIYSNSSTYGGLTIGSSPCSKPWTGDNSSDRHNSAMRWGPLLSCG